MTQTTPPITFVFHSTEGRVVLYIPNSVFETKFTPLTLLHHFDVIKDDQGDQGYFGPLVNAVWAMAKREGFVRPTDQEKCPYSFAFL